MNGMAMATEMAEQPEVLARLAARFDADREAVARLRPAELAGTVFFGRGSSDNAALLGRYLAEMVSGRPAGLGAISVQTRYRVPVDHRGYLAVGLSQSGRTPEIVTALAAARAAGARTIAVTNDPASPLAGAADLCLPLGAGTETAVPATKTVTAQLLVVTAVAAGLGEPGERLVPRADRDALADDAARIVADAAPVEDLAASWSGHRRLLVVARGLLGAAASETALKVRETAGVFAQGTSTADLLHGPIASVDAGVPVLLLDGADVVGPDLAEVAQRAAAAGAPLAWCGPGRALGTGPRVPAEPLQAVLATIRGQQLARSWALALGTDPDAPAGLSKVTVTV